MQTTLRTLFALLVVGVAACGDGPGSGTSNDDVEADVPVIADTGDDAADATGFDVEPVDAGDDAEADAAVDVRGDTSGGCNNVSDCDVGEICVDLLPGDDNGICTTRCTNDAQCPEGMDCVVIGDDELSYEACIDVDFCLDEDEDGFGVGPGCTGADCDDSLASINPGADEVCNAADDDCDGLIDDNVVTAGDDCDTGFAGVCGEGRVTCIGGVEECVARYESTAEICDGEDNDCDGELDEDPTDAPVWYRDVDSDRFGDDEDTAAACSRPSGYVADGGDCDDNDRAVNPTASEICDGFDNDCDGTIDGDGAVGGGTYYLDDDGDGFGDPETGRSGCAEEGWVTNDRDCDDANGDINPDADDICDTIDNDCSGVPDDGGDTERQWFRDADGDGYGDLANERFGCGEPGWVTNSADCDDTDGDIRPGVEDVCDGRDNNCSGTADDGAIGQRTFYRDMDGDSYGDPDVERFGCAETGWVTNDDDCDDNRNFIHPGREDVCDGYDNDCSGVADDGLIPARTYYEDFDRDTYGNPDVERFGCAEEGWVTNDRDCDDNRNFINPSREDVCDGFDNDCSGTPDDGAVPARTYYEDTDGDGFGDPDSSRVGCAETGWVTNDDDCDDGRRAVNPDAEDVCDDVDNDCSGTADDDPAYGGIWYEDGDSDSYGDPLSTRIACDQPAGFVARAQDCDDTRASVNPAGTEVCNGRDDDCNREIDEGVATTFYRDADSDTFGDPNVTRDACTQPGGYVTNFDDCDDSTNLRYPGRAEVCDSLDNDCNGVPDDGVGTTFYYDVDGDGQGGNNTVVSCTQPPGTSSETGDCNDNNPNVYTGAQELCATAFDDDCDTSVNEGVTYLPVGGSAPPDATFYFVDADDDGQGDASAPTDFVLSPLTVMACPPPRSLCIGIPLGPFCLGEQFNYVANRLDCDDTSARAQTPTGTPRNEVVDGYDNECNGTRDDGLGCTRNTYCYDSDGDGWGRRQITACVKPVDDASRWTNADRCGDSDDSDDTVW